MRNLNPVLVVLLTLLLTVAGANHASAQQLAIKGARVLPITAEPIDDGTILIRDGRITAVGPNLSIPIEARVIDAAGKTVLPGFVDVHSAGGMSQPNETNPNVPFLSVVDSIDPSREFFEECRRNGVTTVAVVPGNRTMIGGQAAIVKTAGAYVDDMLLKRHAGIKISLLPKSGSSRMSHLARLRRELEKARRLEAEPANDAATEPEKATEVKPSEEEADEEGEDQDEDQSEDQTQADSDDKTAALRRLIRGELPAFVYCDRGIDVLTAIELTNEFDLKTILVLGRNCYRAAEQVASSELPVVMTPDLVFWQTDPRTGDDEKIVLPQIFAEKRVPLTFQVNTGASSTLGTSYLWYQAATAVRYGTPISEALRSITLRPSEILGISGFVGSIERGKDADLIILSGDPLQVGTWVEMTIIDGTIVYRREEDSQLRELLAPKAD